MEPAEGSPILRASLHDSLLPILVGLSNSSRMQLTATIRHLPAPKAHLTCCRRFRLARSRPPSYHPGVETREERMAADSVYKVIELIGTSSESWEKAARTAVERAAES